MFSKKLFSIVLFGVILIADTQAQNNINNPNNRFGMGEITEPLFLPSRSAGNLSLTFSDTTLYSISNPATYSSLKYANIQVSVVSEFYNIKNNRNSLIGDESTLSGFALAFPISEKHGIGFSMGFMPHSRVNYDIFLHNEDSSMTSSYQGMGRTSKFYAGTSLRLLNNLSLGANISYIFGKIENDHLYKYNEVNVFERWELEEKLISGIVFDAGLLYQHKLKKKPKDILNFGLSAAFGNDLNVDYTAVVFTANNNIIKDTVMIIENQAKKMTFPVKYGFGILYDRPEKWTAGFEVNYVKWSDFTGINDDEVFEDEIRFALGGSWIPDKNSIDNYWKLVTYRGGIEYADTYIQTVDSPSDRLTITTGASFPLRRTVSYLNLALQAGKTGIFSESLINENFFRIYLGFSLSEKWFERRLID